MNHQENTEVENTMGLSYKVTLFRVDENGLWKWGLAEPPATMCPWGLTSSHFFAYLKRGASAREVVSALAPPTG
jgi:hypothetical protein